MTQNSEGKIVRFCYYGPIIGRFLSVAVNFLSGMVIGGKFYRSTEKVADFPPIAGMLGQDLTEGFMLPGRTLFFILFCHVLT